MRESPAIPIIRELLEERAEIRAYDPVAAGEARKLFGNSRIAYCDDLAQTLEEAEVVLLLTRWPEFQQLPIMLENVESPPLVIDGRRMLDKSGIVRYEGIGL
jgi:UDPglucose 6-dehydrogenase/GDP-mannose 6-dehydrogenase